MTITARDIQLKQFKIRLRGFDVQEVDSFLDQLADTLANLEIENERIGDELEKSKNEIEDLKIREGKIKKAYQELKKNITETKEAPHVPSPSEVTVPFMSEQKISGMIITEAQRESDRIISEAHKKAEKLKSEIIKLEQHKILMEDGIRKIVETGVKLLETSTPCPDQKEGDSRIIPFSNQGGN